VSIDPGNVASTGTVARAESVRVGTVSGAARSKRFERSRDGTMEPTSMIAAGGARADAADE